MRKTDLKKIAVLAKVLLVFGLAWAGGCQRTETLNTEYGRIRGLTGGDSINGTKLLADRFEQYGSGISRVSVISPRLNRFSTIVWCPDRKAPPSQQEIDGLENWLRRESNRTLIYVGRDYDAELDYYQSVNAISEMKLDEEFQRTRAEAIVRRLQTDANSDEDLLGFKFISNSEQSNSCQWFQIEQQQRQAPQEMSGPWTDGVDTQKVRLEYSKILAPMDDLENYGPPQMLLKVDDQVFAHAREVELDTSYYGHYLESKLIVVNNGSFLLNFGMINPENRRLADALIAECLDIGQVAFLESGPGEAPVREKNEVHQPWAWVTQPPLRYIVPHVLVLAVLFCFAIYPIFGRPKRYRPKPTSDKSTVIPDSLNPIQHAQDMQSFRSHLVALGNLLRRAQPIEEAKGKVREFQAEQSDSARKRVIYPEEKH